MNQLELFPTDLHLRCIDPATNKRRFYALSRQPPLFGEWALVREWGRIGVGGRFRSDFYPSAGPAIDALLDLSRQKARRGYVAVSATSRCRRDCMQRCSNVSTWRQEHAMGITTITSREFNQDVSRTKRVAKDGPVFITDRGRPAHVLLTIEDYQAIAGGRRSLADAMAAPDLSEIDFDPPRLDVGSRPADLG